MTQSILGQARAEGYRDGAGQMAQVCYDEAHEEGRLKGVKQGEAHTRRWGWFCFLCGIALSTLVWDFWP